MGNDQAVLADSGLVVPRSQIPRPVTRSELTRTRYVASCRFGCRPIATTRQTMWAASESLLGKKPREVGRDRAGFAMGIRVAASVTRCAPVVGRLGLPTRRLSFLVSTSRVREEPDGPANGPIGRRTAERLRGRLCSDENGTRHEGMMLGRRSWSVYVNSRNHRAMLNHLTNIAITTSCLHGPKHRGKVQDDQSRSLRRHGWRF